MSAEEFPVTIRQRVRFAETDAQKVVYHSNYLVYAEVGRYALLRHLGVDSQGDVAAHGIDITIGEATVRYRAPLHFDEEFDVKVRVGEIHHASFVLDYRVDRADGLHCAKIATTQVVLNVATGRADAIPGHLRAKLECGQTPLLRG